MAEPQVPGSFLKATLESQPAELTRLVGDDSAARAATRLRGCARIFLAGTGTSFHGALVGQFMLRSAGVEALRGDVPYANPGGLSDRRGLPSDLNAEMEWRFQAPPRL
jgi:hypothetical protein